MLVLDRPTGRAVKAFAESVDHCKISASNSRAIGLDVEELVAIGNKTFEAIIDLDARRHAMMFDQGGTSDDPISLDIEALYLAWADPASRLLALVQGLPDRRIEGIETLVEHISLAISPFDDGARVMSDEMVALRDAAIDDHRKGETVELHDLDD